MLDADNEDYIFKPSSLRAKIMQGSRVETPLVGISPLSTLTLILQADEATFLGVRLWVQNVESVTVTFQTTQVVNVKHSQDLLRL